MQETFSSEVLMRVHAKILIALLTICLFHTKLAFAHVEVIDAHAKYPEGPLWDQGRLLYVDYAGSDIKMWDGREAKVYWRKDHCGANSLIHFHEGHILVACYDGNYLVELDARGKEVRTITRNSSGKPFIGPNDLTTDGHEGVYFSASGVYDINAPISGTVLHLAADGGDPREVADTIHYSNGLTLSKDGQHLLVAEMLAGRILSFPIQANGSLGPRIVWARLQDLAPPTPNEDAYNGPDGIKVGSDGHYYIAQNGSGRVLVVNEEKQLVRAIEVPTPYVTNVAFGPAGTDTLYITGVFDPWKPPFPGAVYRVTP
jgi:sugar lactone lactonase YvrE